MPKPFEQMPAKALQTSVSISLISAIYCDKHCFWSLAKCCIKDAAVNKRHHPVYEILPNILYDLGSHENFSIVFAHHCILTCLKLYVH